MHGADLSASGGIVGSTDRPIDHPARVRLWSSTSGKLTFAAQTTVSAAIHAPAAELVVPMGLSLHGAALVNTVALSGSHLDIFFDRALLSGGNRACGTAITTPLP